MGKQTGAIRFTGKLANVVGYKAYSGDAIRERVSEVRNPKSVGQNVQRMIMATVAIAMSFLTKICNNSVRGKAYGNPSLNYIRRVWLNELRADIANQGGANSVFNPKGTSHFCPNAYLLSKGNLAGVGISIVTGSARLNSIGVSLSNIASASFSQLFPYVKLGHQLTFVAVYHNMTTGEPLVGYARIAAKTNENPFLVATGEQGVYKINPAAVNMALAEGAWQDILFDAGDGTHLDINPYVAQGADDTTPLIAAAIIVSDKATGNRSTTRLVLSPSIRTYYPANWENASATYGATASTVDVPAEAYLDNSVDVPTEAPAENLNIVKIFETEDHTEEPVEKQNLITGRSYTVVMNQNITGLSVSTSLASVNVSQVLGDRFNLIPDADAEGSFTITVGESIFGGFYMNS